MNTNTYQVEKALAILAILDDTTHDHGLPAPSDQGLYVLVRGDRSGVFCGVLASRDGTEVELREARHIWSWFGALSMAQMAVQEPSRTSEWKVSDEGHILVLDAIEVAYCNLHAQAGLQAVPTFTP